MVPVIYSYPSVAVHRNDVELAKTKSQELLLLQIRNLERFEVELHPLIQFLLESAGEGDGDSLVQFKINAGVNLVLGRRPAKFLLQLIYCLLTIGRPVLRPQL